MGPSLLPVYLVHWDAPQWCASAAASILESTGVDVELTVVDNGQTEGPPLPSCLPDGVRVLPMADNRGYTGGANAAIADWRARHPEAEYCVVGSHDLHLEPRTLEELVAAAELRPRAGVVAPGLVGPVPRSGGRWAGGHSFQVSLEGAGDVVRRDWASGTCMLLRRACVDDVGMFDERLGSYMEDVDYGLRATDAGWDVVVVTTAHARGLGSSSPSALAAIAANTVLLNLKRGGARGAASSLWSFGVWIGRGLVGGVAPWRSREARLTSRFYARQRLAGIYEVVASGRLVRALADTGWRRHPGRPGSQDDTETVSFPGPEAPDGLT